LYSDDSMVELTVGDVLIEHSTCILGANQFKSFDCLSPESKAVSFSETPVIVYQSTRGLIPECLYLQDVRSFAVSLRANGRTVISSP
jgi:hypothetical protein